MIIFTCYAVVVAGGQVLSALMWLLKLSSALPFEQARMLVIAQSTPLVFGT